MITINGLSQGYHREDLYREFNISFETSKITSIIGASGCGKTTLLRIMSGLEPYEKGRITGIDKNKLSYVFQEDRLLPWLSVEENLSLVLRNRKIPDSQRNQMIQEMLEILKLKDSKEKMPNELSGGMQRRVALGRALVYDLACDGELILLDEPFKGLDTRLKDEILEACKSIWEKYKRTVILVTHELEDAKKLSDCIYEFYGRPVEWRRLTEGKIGVSTRYT